MVEGIDLDSAPERFAPNGSDLVIRIRKERTLKAPGPWDSDLHCRGVDVELSEDGESLLEELVADGDVGDVGGVVVVQAVDVLHNAGAVGLDGGQDQEVLQVPGGCERRSGDVKRTRFTRTNVLGEASRTCAR